MKSTIFNNPAKSFSIAYLIKFVFPLVLIFFLAHSSATAQSFCSTPEPHGTTGYITSIESVIENGDGTFTIVLRGEHNGCNDSQCKALNHYSIEAVEGTYSDVTHVTVYGNMTYGGINMGPNLGGTPFDGFRIASTNGIGNGIAGVFHVVYTLTYLQDQRVQVKSGGMNSIVEFFVQDFIDVLECSMGGAYAMPPGGKINDATNKIGPELTALSNVTGVPLTDDVYKIVPDETVTPPVFYVVAEFVAETGQYSTLLSTLTNSHGLREEVGDGISVISGQIPIGELSFLNDVTSLASARPVYPVTTNVGAVTSQGDVSMVSDVARNIFSINDQNGNPIRDINGEGIKVGVMSNSFDTKTDPPNQANDDVLKWDLPGVGVKSDGTLEPNPYNDTDVNSLKEYPYGEASDEGRAMLQIIHDVAPGADLYFRTGVLGAVDMAAGIDELVNAGCDIIVDDITYITQPFFEDGPLAQKVNSVNSNGVSYFTSAGNFGGKSYTSTFSSGTTTLSGVVGTPHIFGTDSDGNEDVFQGFTAEIPVDANPPLNYTIVLQWEDGSSFNTTNTDLDIYIADENGNNLIGYNTVNTGSRAIEVLPFVVTETTDASIVIVKASNNTATINFKYVVFRGPITNVEYPGGIPGGDATIVGHANSAGAMTVGAIRFDKTPAFGGTLDIMSYSSIGGLVTDGTNRSKPDFTAPNGVNTSVDLGNGDWDDPIIDPDTDYPNFFGTSASSPHTAAVAALLLDAKSSYYGVSMLPDEVRSSLITGAIGSGSYDAVYGNGFIQADAALGIIGNPAPILNELTSIIGTPGIEDVTITVSADYLTEGTVLYFNGNPITTTVNLVDGTLEAIVPPFTELYPPITAENPPKATLGNDGGTSNTIYFTEKPTVVGTLIDRSKTYGENMPDIGITYEVVYLDGSTLTLANAGMSTDQINRISGIQILNNADALANAGIWPYNVDPHDWLNPLYLAPNPVVPQTTLEIELLATFNFSFDIGVLDILKLELTIKPNDITLDFGAPIPPLTYTYDYDGANITTGNNAIIQTELAAAHLGDVIEDIVAVLDDDSFMSDGSGGLVPNSYYMSVNASLALAMVNRQALAMVNGKALAMVNGKALAMVNGQALAMVNGAALAMVNGQALAMVNIGTLLNAQALAMVNVDEDGQTNGLALAMVNGQALAMVNNPDPQWLDPSYVNGQALAMVNQDQLTNGLALAMVNQGGGLVNGQALAMVNTISFNDINNEDAILILTVDDVRILMGEDPPAPIEMISLNTASGNSATNIDPPLPPHKIAPGAFNASNFNMDYALGDLTVDPAEITFGFGGLQATYDGSIHQATVTTTYPDHFTTAPDPEPYFVTYINVATGDVLTEPVNAGTYTVKVTITDPNFTFDPNVPSQAELTINPAPVSFNFGSTLQTYNGGPLPVTTDPVYLTSTPEDMSWDVEYYYNDIYNLIAPTNAGEYSVIVTITNPNYILAPTGNSTTLLTIEPAPVSFTFEGTTQIYNGGPLPVTTAAVYFTPTPEDMTWFVEYYYNDLYNLIAPTNVGEYPVSVTITNPNYLISPTGNSTTLLAINPALVSFTFDNLSQIYNGESLLVSVTPNVTNSTATAPVEGTDFNVVYDGAHTDVGNYGLGISVSNTNYDIASYVPAIPSLTINPALVSFTFVNLFQIYNGESLLAGVTSNVTNSTATAPVEGTDFNVVYDGEHTSVGNYGLSIFVSNTNYDIAYYVPDAPALIIDPALVLFAFDNLYQNYTGNPLAVSVTPTLTNSTATVPVEGSDFNVVYDGTHTNVGEYGVSISISNTNYDLASYVPDPPIFTINPVTVTFSFSNTSLPYSGSAQWANVTPISTPAIPSTGYTVEYSQNGVTVTDPIDVGTYNINITVSDNNYSYTTGSAPDFEITPAPLTISGDSQVINEGMSLPPFTFIITGFVSGDTEGSVFPNGPIPITGYNPSGSGPGEYLVSIADPPNYIITITPDIYLYVNPDGPGTKSVVPKLDCVTESGGLYTAYFEYENRNNVPVWVMIGPDNLVTGGGTPDLQFQPFKFEPGGGAWIATFDGSPMTWELSSQDHGHKASHAQNASSNSRNCNKSAEIEPPVGGDDEFARVYPNPVSGKLTVSMDEDKVIREVSVYNLVGKKTNVSERRISDQMLELDMTSLKAGVYLVKVQMETTTKIFRVIKQ